MNKWRGMIGLIGSVSVVVLFLLLMVVSGYAQSEPCPVCGSTQTAEWLINVGGIFLAVAIMCAIVYIALWIFGFVVKEV